MVVFSFVHAGHCGVSAGLSAKRIFAGGDDGFSVWPDACAIRLTGIDPSLSTAAAGRLSLRVLVLPEFPAMGFHAGSVSWEAGPSSAKIGATVDCEQPIRSATLQMPNSFEEHEQRFFRHKATGSGPFACEFMEIYRTGTGSMCEGVWTAMVGDWPTHALALAQARNGARRAIDKKMHCIALIRVGEAMREFMAARECNDVLATSQANLTLDIAIQRADHIRLRLTEPVKTHQVRPL